MIYTVNLNPSFDHHQRYDIFHNSYTKIIFGGKANNASKIITKFQKEAVFAISFCDLQGFSRVSAYLKHDGINHKLFFAEGRIREYNKVNEEKEMYGYGIILTYSKLDEVINFLNERLTDSDALYLAGSLPPTCPRDAYEYILSNIENKNVKIFLDTRFENMKYCLEREIFAIKPNEEEIQEIIPNFDHKNPKSLSALKDFYSSHKIKHIIVSLGPKGLYYIGLDGSYHLDTIDVEVLSTVGCGDSLLSTFAYNTVVCKDNIRESLLKGLAVSTLVASYQEEANLDKYQAFLEQIRDINN